MRKRYALLALATLTGCSVTASASQAETTVATTTTEASTTTSTSTTTTSTTTTTTTIPPTTTLALVAGDWTCPEAVTLGLSVGWPADQLEKLDRIIARETGRTCDPMAHNPYDPGSGSYGLMQINGATWCDGNSRFPEGWLQQQGIISSCTDLFDPEMNLKAGLALWHRSGWRPWGG